MSTVHFILCVKLSGVNCIVIRVDLGYIFTYLMLAGTSATTRASSRAQPPTPPSNSTSGPSFSSPCPTSGAAMSSTCRFDLYWPLLTSNIDHKLIDLINTILNLCQPKLTATDFCKPKLTLTNLIQGDTSGCAKPSIDFKTKVPFLPGLDRPKRNFCCEVNWMFWTSVIVTLYACTHFRRQLPWHARIRSKGSWFHP